MNLQENIQRIREMMNLLIEEEDDYTHTDNLLDVSQKITDLLGGIIPWIAQNKFLGKKFVFFDIFIINKN